MTDTPPCLGHYADPGCPTCDDATTSECERVYEAQVQAMSDQPPCLDERGCWRNRLGCCQVWLNWRSDMEPGWNKRLAAECARLRAESENANVTPAEFHEVEA